MPRQKKPRPTLRSDGRYVCRYKGQYFYSYLSEGKTYKVWVENRDSIKTKLSILDKYRLAGVAGWRKGHETPDVWDTIRTLVKNR